MACSGTGAGAVLLICCNAGPGVLRKCGAVMGCTVHPVGKGGRYRLGAKVSVIVAASGCGWGGVEGGVRVSCSR